MKILWLGLGGALAYLLLSKEKGVPIVGPLPQGVSPPPPTPVPGLSTAIVAGELTGGVQAPSQAQAFPPLTAAGLTLSPPQVVDVGRDPPCFRSEMLASNGKCYPIFFGA